MFNLFYSSDGGVVTESGHQNIVIEHVDLICLFILKCQVSDECKVFQRIPPPPPLGFTKVCPEIGEQ